MKFKKPVFSPSTFYRLPTDFWFKLYSTCFSITQNAPPIIDMSGTWFTPLIAAVKLGVPYFNFDFNISRYDEIKKDFKPLQSLIGNFLINYFIFNLFRK